MDDSIEKDDDEPSDEKADMVLDLSHFQDECHEIEEENRIQ